MALLLISAGVMVLESPAHSTAVFAPTDEDEDIRDRDPEDTPETPLDEPPPSPVQDPPSEPSEKGPYVVSGW
jgi:hypothetical protein